MNTIGLWSLVIGSSVLILGSLYAIGRKIYQTVNSNAEANQPSNSSPEPTPPPSNTRGGFGWWTLIITAIIVSLLTWMVIYLLGQNETKPPPTSNEKVQKTQPREEWSFSQVESNGRKRTFEVEVTKGEPGVLWFVVQQKCGGEKRNMGGFKLDSNGEGWVGTWVNYLDQDYGEVRLDRADNHVWSGHYTLQDGSRVDCVLKLTMR